MITKGPDVRDVMFLKEELTSDLLLMSSDLGYIKTEPYISEDALHSEVVMIKTEGDDPGVMFN